MEGYMIDRRMLQLFCIDELADLRKTGVYMIRNTVNHRVYIGCTGNGFEGRWRDHVNSLNRGVHKSALMTWDWQTYGADAFAFHILEVIPSRSEKWIYRAREAFWMHEVGEAAYNTHIYSDRARKWLGVA
jgi:group I intron endonuclease